METTQKSQISRSHESAANHKVNKNRSVRDGVSYLGCKAKAWKLVRLSMMYIAGDEPEHSDPTTPDFYVARVAYQAYLEYQKQLLLEIDGERVPE